ncbi:MAG: hypothetical protein Q8M37_12335 [Nevskia sp.]|nr:hypothetical protein [Nevskia sp.]
MQQLSDIPVTLTASDCRSTLCRLDFNHADPYAINDLLDRFPNLLAWNSDLRARTTENVQGGYTTTVFMTRDGQVLPTLASDQ